jgi:glycerol-3-phosphate acyltransferase PlsY
MILTGIILLVISYVLGSISFSVRIGKWIYGVDVREHGSGNAGATNTFRVLGTTAGTVVLVLDVLKGLLAVMLPVWWLNEIQSPVLFENFRVMCGAAAVLGHVFPVFERFKGGKGVATLLGVAVGMFPQVALICIGLFLMILLLTRYVSLGSILASLAYGLILLLVERVHHDASIIYAICIPLLVIITHKANIQRLIAGSENRTDILKKFRQNEN